MRILLIILCCGRYPIKAMINIISWNVGGLNSANKQLEIAKFLSFHNIGLFGLLKMKVKRSGLVLFIDDCVIAGVLL